MLGEPAEQARRQDRVLVAILAGQVSREAPGVGGPPVGEPAQRDHLAVGELSVQVRELGPEPDSDPCQLGPPLAAASGEALGEGAPHGLGDRHDEGLCGQGPLGDGTRASARSCTPCWWTRGPVCAAPSAPTGCWTSPWKRPGPPGWWERAGSWTPPPCTTPWQPWTR